VLLVEDDRDVRETVGDLLQAEGYEVELADNGQQALNQLRAEAVLPDAIVLDLNMPVMDGWQFRAIQKEDPGLSGIPVIAVSADRSAPAVAISSQAYIQKPFDFPSLIRTLDRVLFESERQRMSVRLEQAERLASLGRIAAGVGHEINNPLMFSLLNLQQALAQLRAMYLRDGNVGGEGSGAGSGGGSATPGLRVGLPGVLEMLGDCEIGLERIRQTVGNLQRLSRRGLSALGTIDVRAVMEESISMAWNQIRHRARLVRSFTTVEPMVWGNASALGQVFLNVLVNGAQSIPEGQAERQEIFVSIAVTDGEVVVEVRDTGGGIPADVLPHVFDPFFTTKSVGLGTGLGLSISRQTVNDFGGRIELTSRTTASAAPSGAPGKPGIDGAALPPGTSCHIFLPLAAPVIRPSPVEPAARGPAVKRAGRLLVIDDEEAIGRVVGRAFADRHEVTVVQHARDAFARFEAGERFDLVLCDLLMPSVSGPDVYAMVVERWPDILPSLVFMTGGAFTPSTAEFAAKGLTPLLQKPFRIADVQALLESRLHP
jgi:signal transduction histidine kinase